MSYHAMRTRAFDAGKPFADWLVYVPGKVDELPAPASSRPLPGLGTLVRVQPEPPEGIEAGELRHIGRVQALLQR